MSVLLQLCLCAVSVLASHSDEISLVDYYTELITKEKDRAFKHPIIDNANQYQPLSSNYSDYGTFDHIVIGAGSAGAVVANRLTEDAFTKVLLLEAGGHQSHFSDIPSMAFYLQGLEYNWNYFSIPQTTSCLGMFKRQCSYPRGRGVGGTSIINGLIYSRGNKNDYNNWFVQGNPGWSFDDVLPFFKKVENFQYGDDRFHGKGGVVNVEYHDPISPQASAFLEANEELGRRLVDYNGENQLGVSRTQLNKYKGRRLSTGNTFLLPALQRKNLDISIDSFVIKILINRRKRAYGVIFSKYGKVYFAKSRHDIILSAGVFGSPQILMLSGIGPRFHLEHIKIPVVEDLPVGDNLQDQPAYYNLEFTSDYTEPTGSLQQLVKDYLNNFGPLTNPLNAQAVAFLQTKYAPSKNVPDIEALLIASNNTNDFSLEVFHYNRETYKAILEKNQPHKTFSIYVNLLHPKSRGSFRLNSKNPFEYPRIDPRLLSDSDDQDIETLYQGIQLILKMENTTAFQKLGAKLKYEPLPACKRYDYLSKKYWYCQLRQLTTSSFNPVGTCKMGSNPKDSVVDSDLNVHGIKNLRVADTSIFPTTISGHPSAAASMIGEKVADLIRNPTFKGYGKLKEKLQNLEKRVKMRTFLKRLV
ncbi:hypothetical protein RI129_007894 [Pyrocoelia pectoralis]|uniref:Glucose-methanol-choline oxidoreductase N-terminal domain-containing protein n=1 Tax=Pyrocoelia pectoralis TaxID=417401 RepID=A0AAN7VD69_9COLE